MSGVLFWFILFTVITIVLGLVAGRYGNRNREDYLLASRTLGPIAVGISAGATANSGFIMLGAVGLGYSYGITWVILPVAWLLGDLLFWAVFPTKINRQSREAGAATIPELLVSRETKSWRMSRLLLGLLLIAVVTTYGASQALAGAKTLNALFQSPPWLGALVTIIAVGVYCLWGGFRASIWTDLLQGVMMLAVTVVISVFTCLLVTKNPQHWEYLKELGSGHLTVFTGLSAPFVVGFFLSWATAGVGFGLSQPQVVARYFAGRDDKAVRRAKWVYIVFVQLTWVGMTTFGVLVRGLLHDVADPEMALFAYAKTFLPEFGVGLILASVFAAIISTLDSIVLAAGGILSSDIIPAVRNANSSKGAGAYIFGAASTLVAVFVIASASSMNVFQLSVLPVELVAASVGPIMAVHLLCGQLSCAQIVVGVVMGIAGVVSWRQTGFEPIVSSALTGLLPFGVLIAWRWRERRAAFIKQHTNSA